MARVYKNLPERMFAEDMVDNGWEVTKRGWPDFACFKDGKLMLVEVKKDKNTHLKKSQYRLMSALAQRGILCYYWEPNTGLRQIC